MRPHKSTNCFKESILIDHFLSPSYAASRRFVNSMRFVKLLSIFALCSHLSGCSNKEEETPVEAVDTELGQSQGGFGGGMVNGLGLGVGANVPIPAEVESFEKEVRKSKAMNDRYVSLSEDIVKKIGMLLMQKFESVKSTIFVKFNALVDSTVTKLVSRYPQLDTELRAAVAAYKRQVAANSVGGMGLADVEGIPAFQALLKKAQALGVADMIGQEWHLLEGQLVLELKQALKTILESMTDSFDSEVDKAAAVFIGDFPEMEAKARAAISAMKAHFRAEIAQL